MSFSLYASTNSQQLSAPYMRCYNKDQVLSFLFWLSVASRHPSAERVLSPLPSVATSSSSAFGSSSGIARCPVPDGSVAIRRGDQVEGLQITAYSL